MIQMAHFSVQEFLIVSEEGGRHHECQFSVANGHKALLTATMDCLLEQTKVSTPNEAAERPFLSYAAQNWSTHATASGDIDRLDPSLKSKINRLFTQPTVYLNWVCIERSTLISEDEWLITPESCELPIHRAAWMGFLEAVEELLNQGADPEANGIPGSYGSALQGASFQGHEKIVQVLLDRGANFNSPGGMYGTALQSASLGGHENIVQILLDGGADVNAPDGDYGGALQAAAARGHGKIVQILLDQHADVNARGGEYGSPLQAASYGGYENIVRTLLDRHADFNAPNGRYGGALQAAAEGGHGKIVQMLLDHGADPNTDGPIGTALLIAVMKGNNDIVEILLGHGVDVNAQGDVTPLQQAAAFGQTETVQLLLDRGADVNAPDGAYGSVLEAAAGLRDKTIFQMLLDLGEIKDPPW
jgi:ankyrin repeat protein